MKADTLETPKAMQPQLVAAACAEAAKPGRLRGRKGEGGLRGYFGFKTKVCGYQGLVQGSGDVGSGTGFKGFQGFCIFAQFRFAAQAISVAVDRFLYTCLPCREPSFSQTRSSKCDAWFELCVNHQAPTALYCDARDSKSFSSSPLHPQTSPRP